MKHVYAMAIVFMIAAALVLAGCGEPIVSQEGGDLFNDSLNQELEDLANASDAVEPGFMEFMIEVPVRNESKYELALDDAFTLSDGNLTSLDISVLGVMLGDSYDSVVARLGIPDVTLVAPNQSYRNMEYGKKIGVGSKTTAITFHVENDSVTSINVRKTFNKYLHGNTSFDQTNSYLYEHFDTPDYQDFILNHKVFHYIEKGIDFYMNRDKTQIMVFYAPKEFNGVEFITVIEDHDGFPVNVTKAVLK